MEDNLILSSAISIVVFVVIEVAQSKCTDPLFGLINWCADNTVSFDPVCAAIIRSIPAIIGAATAFGILNMIAPNDNSF